MDLAPVYLFRSYYTGSYHYLYYYLYIINLTIFSTYYYLIKAYYLEVINFYFISFLCFIAEWLDYYYYDNYFHINFYSKYYFYFHPNPIYHQIVLEIYLDFPTLFPFHPSGEIISIIYLLISSIIFFNL